MNIIHTVELWKNLVELHNDLLIITVKEYRALITQNIGDIEQITVEKENLLKSIMAVDDKRINLTKELKVDSVADLAKLWEMDEGANDLIRYNNQLKDVILKIKEQNVKNQLFYHKLMKSLSSLKREFKNNTYQIYDKRGLTTE